MPYGVLKEKTEEVLGLYSEECTLLHLGTISQPIEGIKVSKISTCETCGIASSWEKTLKNHFRKFPSHRWGIMDRVTKF